jgi:hypothetical protein
MVLMSWVAWLLAAALLVYLWKYNYNKKKEKYLKHLKLMRQRANR